MDSKVVHPSSDIHEHAAGDDQHHEKPSVLTKVKAKAKKIRDTLKKHGPGQNHDHDRDDQNDGHTPDDLEEEDHEYEETVGDPEVHDAPRHGQPLASRDVSGVKSSEEEPHASLNIPVSSFSHGVYEKKDSTDPSRTFVSGSTANLGESRANLRRPKGLEEDPPAPKEFNRQDHSNYQTKVSDPTGTATTEINPTNAASYTEKLYSATSVIADKAISAKNVVASKLGYGEKDDTTDHRVHDNEAHGSGDGSTAKPSSTVEYGKKIAATETDKPTSVYEKVTGAGSTVISKMFGSGTTSAGNEAEKTEIKGQDRGVRPGDEDGAHSEGISDALHKRKQEPEKAESGPPVGKVTQSEEVTRRLGTGDEKSDRQERDEPATGYENRPEIGGGGDGKGVVNKLKGTVGSWFGLGGGDQPSETSYAGDEQGNSASSVGGDSISKDDRRVQESGN